MRNTLKSALGFMSRREQFRFYTFLALRAFVAVFDLAGILLIGLLATSIALFITNGSNSEGTIALGAFVFPAVTYDSLPFVAVLVMFLFVSKAFLSIFLTRQLAHFLARIEARAAKVIARNAFGKGLEGARLNSREQILFAVQSGSPSAFNFLLNSIGTLVAEGFLFVVVLVAFSFVNWIVAIGAILYFGLIGFLIQFFIGRLMQSTGMKIAESAVEANSGLLDLGEVLREATILNNQEFFYNKIYRSRLRASSNFATQVVLSGMPRYIVETALMTAIAIIILFQILRGDIVSSAATLGIFLSGGLRLTASLLPLQSALLTIRQSLPEADRALALIYPSEVLFSPHGNVKQLIEPKNPIHVSIENLCFVYKGSESTTLNNISLEIPPGSQVAFIGVSGAGKSTLADLILGLLKPTSGQVLINGKLPADLIEMQPGLMGYVPQRPGMVSGTIAQNIALGLEVSEIDQTLLSKAISGANLDALIESLPNGINTDLGKHKDELSGGQLQRIGLARALYTQPMLLVMDEATSALDAESEAEVNKSLDEMRGKATVILIAHRLNTIQRSDIVFFIEDGEVAAYGTFAELLGSNLKVRKLAELMAVEMHD
jgi:ABC-type bacteriocin/lantibiotic exporter with double-glycine peptidase domain